LGMIPAGGRTKKNIASSYCLGDNYIDNKLFFQRFIGVMNS